MLHRRFHTLRFVILAVAILTVAAPMLDTFTAWAQPEQAPMQNSDAKAVQWAVLAAALSVSVGCIGAAVAVAYVGAAAVAAVAEKPQIAGRTLIFVGLAEGIAIYGLIIAIMILAKV